MIFLRLYIYSQLMMSQMVLGTLGFDGLNADGSEFIPNLPFATHSAYVSASDYNSDSLAWPQPTHQ